MDPFLEAKLHWPTLREGWVWRSRLLDLLDRAVRRPVTLVSAPAGYGKTTVVAQWLAARRGERSAAWVSLDGGDNDPARLWTHVATALHRAGCVVAPDLPAFLKASSGDVGELILPALVSAMTEVPGGVTLVLDDVHALQSRECLEQVGVLIQNLPPTASLICTSRSDPGLRLGRLRASGQLAEVRAGDLAFTLDEAHALIAAEGVHLAHQEVSDLVSDTEGWPAGIYLTILSLSRGHRSGGEAHRLTLPNRFVGAYVSEEILSQHPEPVRELILATAVVERFCPPLCDVLTGTEGSATTLRTIAQDNLFLVPLDDVGHWYRFHHFFAAVARSELEAVHSDRVPTLHRRAAEWFRANGYVDDAVKHLIAAGEHRTAASVIQENWFDFYDVGRVETVRGWLRGFDPGTLAADPAAAVTAAWLATVQGDRPAVAQHLSALERLGDVGPLPDGTHSVESAAALIRASYGYGGPADMALAARRAADLETDPRTRSYAIAHHSLGHCAYLQGDLDEAMARLAELRQCEAAPATLRVNGLALEALIHDERGQYEQSREAASQALAVVDARAMRDRPQMSISLTALAQVQASAGDLAEAMATCRQGLAIRRRYPTYAPWMTIHHLTVSARVAVRTGDLAWAGELLHEVDDLVAGYDGGMDGVHARLGLIRAAVRAGAGATTAEEDLTEREVEVLRLMQGPMSLREIGTELYLSTNTVKSHARAVFRKLGVHSRREAVDVARRRRLI